MATALKGRGVSYGFTVTSIGQLLLGNADSDALQC